MTGEDVGEGKAARTSDGGGRRSHYSSLSRSSRGSRSPGAAKSGMIFSSGKKSRDSSLAFESTSGQESDHNKTPTSRHTRSSTLRKSANAKSRRSDRQSTRSSVRKSRGYEESEDSEEIYIREKLEELEAQNKTKKLQ